MQVWSLILTALIAGTALPAYVHYRVHEVVNVHQVTLAFFLWLNFIIALWEICLFLRIDSIEKQHQRLIAHYRGRELDCVKAFFLKPVPVSRMFSPALWGELWATYSVFDESYASKKSFGFFVDIGNGFTTLIPTLLFLYGMSFELVPARALGIVGLLLFYQMWYGTIVYFASFVLNKRYAPHSPLNLAIFVGLTNGLWLTLPLWGIYASIVLVYSDSYALFLR